MVWRGPGVLLGVVLFLAASAGLILVLDTGSERHDCSVEFQQLVGGVGFGPALDLSVCPFAFDPRLGSHCAWDDGPIPGGSCFCPYHASSIVDYPPLSSRTVGAPE